MFVVGASIVHPVCTNESGQQERSTVRDAGWVRYIGWPQNSYRRTLRKSKSAVSQYLQLPIPKSSVQNNLKHWASGKW